MGFKYPDMFHILPCSLNYQTNNLYKDFNVISEQVNTDFSNKYIGHTTNIIYYLVVILKCTRLAILIY